ncbi:MAG: flagellar hook-length control protein FliK [Syntrophomonadaceae bacterium]|nr:flagellar hook-length control protein FliK [Syntrophomonadaceae bacterium]
MQMVEMQAAVPVMSRKSEKAGLSSPKAKAGLNSFNKQLQKLTRNSSESKDLPYSTKEAVVERPETSISSYPAKQIIESDPFEKPFPVSRKQTGQAVPRELTAIDEELAVDEELKLESTAQEVSNNMNLSDIPVLMAQEIIPELPAETAAQLSESASLEVDGADLLIKLPQDTAQVIPLQENPLPHGGMPKEQVSGLQQLSLSEVVLSKQVPVMETITIGSISDETAANHMEPITGEAAPIKQVPEIKLPLAIQDSAIDLKPLLSEIIPAQPEMAVDKLEKQAQIKAETNAGSEQHAPEAVPASEAGAISAGVVMELGMDKPEKQAQIKAETNAGSEQHAPEAVPVSEAGAISTEVVMELGINKPEKQAQIKTETNAGSEPLGLEAVPASETEAISTEVVMEPGMDKPEKQAEMETGSELELEAVTVSESPTVQNMAVLTQLGIASQQNAKLTDANNPGRKTKVLGAETVIDAGVLVNKLTSGDKKAASIIVPEQANMTAESDQASTESMKSESKPTQSEIRFKAVAGMETKLEKAQNKQTPTDVKKLIEYESKRLKTDSGEGIQAKAETVVKGEKAEGETSLLLLGKTGLESDKAQLIRSTALPTTSSLIAEPEQVLDQIVKKAEMMVKLNSSEMKIQLQPEFLGKMTIKISVEEGLVTARFITDSHQVKQMLDSNLNTLKQTLEAQGIRVEKTEVNVQLNNGGMFDGSGQNSQESWQRQQFMSSQYQPSFTDQGYQTGLGNADIDEIEASAISEQDYGIGSNGTMNFLV